MNRVASLVPGASIISSQATGQAGGWDRVARDDAVTSDHRDLERDRRALVRDYREARYFGRRERLAARLGNYEAAGISDGAGSATKERFGRNAEIFTRTSENLPTTATGKTWIAPSSAMTTGTNGPSSACLLSPRKERLR